MNRGRRRGILAIAAIVCALEAFPAPASAAKTTAPYRVTLGVAWGQGAGSDAFRDDLSRSLAQALASRCFSGVVLDGGDSSGAESELEFQVVLSHAVDETRFDDSIAGALQPGEPSQELRRVTYFKVSVDAALTTKIGGNLIHRKHIVSRVSRRPVFVGEDPRAIARAEAIDNIVRDLTRALGCGGDKLSRKIRAALDAR